MYGHVCECVYMGGCSCVSACTCACVSACACACACVSAQLMWEEVIEAPKRIICLSLMISGKELIVVSRTNKATNKQTDK